MNTGVEDLINMKKLYFVLFVLSTVMLASCGSMKPSTFKATDGGEWSTIMLRDGITYEEAFGEVLDVCAKRFEMDMISKDGGYGRTNWCYTWNKKGKHTEKYRTRVVFKFSPNRQKVDIKTEAEFGGAGKWVRGCDTRLLSTMKSDIGGVIGRTAL